MELAGQGSPPEVVNSPPAQYTLPSDGSRHRENETDLLSYVHQELQPGREEQREPVVDSPIVPSDEMVEEELEEDAVAGCRFLSRPALVVMLEEDDMK